MIKPIPRQQCHEQYSKLPTNDELGEEILFPKIINSYILTSDFKDNAEKLSYAVSDWIQHMGLESLVFLGETEMPWLPQNNETRQVKEAFQYFKAQKVDETFNGAFLTNNRELPEFVKHLFWLTRCNASFPIVYFTDENQGLIGSLCKYGNLHIFTISAEIDNSILPTVNQSQFKLATGMQC